MTFNVLLVGAGEINFGSVEGPWNHLGTSLRVVGLVDPDQSRAAAALAGKQASDAASAYTSCKTFSTVAEAVANLSDGLLPQLAIVGAPPFARGSDVPGADIELQLSTAFPGCALFVEKPVSSGPVDGSQKRRTLVGVGYMLRYSRGRKIIEENNLVVMGTNARYVMAYEWARKLPWWNKDSSGGRTSHPLHSPAPPIGDLSRYFGGDVILPSVSAHTVVHDDAPGALSAKRFDESAIPPEKRLPRLTSATWKYTGGAVGALTHVIALHGTTYDTEFEVYADGYRLKLIDPYGSAPVLSVRKPGDDPFYTEISTMIDAIREPDSDALTSIHSSYEDAVKTYELTWQIRHAGEETTRRFGTGQTA
ncbi:putative oxidoreductase C terminal-domain-containing protein [Fomitopsis serialis]|uniref:putative oxidoreductase C terminal-domain-containing protein n=1 Tax=Fomitopsis serialis TaxID=139415 RepID=UPI0020074C2E|nr:putative oxidoreductase C terminal-domain-containing protein [Neoantrodia serialis]KAH9920425.1 putative oxidoreductase C terminal-domain-containing protein [Neoantrodia serialis]